MGLFDLFGKKKKAEQATGLNHVVSSEGTDKPNNEGAALDETDADLMAKEQKATTTKDWKERYGQAWLMIVGQTQKAEGLKIMAELDAEGHDEAIVVRGMFANRPDDRQRFAQRAAKAGNVEGLWELCNYLPHSYCPDPKKPEDLAWETLCLNAAEGGSADAMNEMGNVCHRRAHYAESMYWYAMANYYGHPDGMVSMGGIAQEWKKAGEPRAYVAGTSTYNEARHKCAIAFLEIHADEELSVSLDELITLNMNGLPLAAYLTGDIFEQQNNFEMAYKMYNMIAFEHDAHGIKCYADMLFTGRGVDKDIQNAIRFYQMAAEYGDREAMFTMGEFTRNSNKNMAAYWYGLAHTRGYEHALTRLIQMAQ